MEKTIKSRISADPVALAEIDLIVPFHGQYQKTYDLCKSIWHNTKSNRYHLYLVDDHSPNKTYIPAFQKAPHTTVIQNKTQLGFGASLYEGFEKGKSPWVLFMHSDCLVETADWLTALLITYFKNPKTAMVSPRTNNPGVEDERLKADKGTRQPDCVLEKGYLPLYCALCPRQLFGQIGGFIKPYPFRYYEDEELGHRIRAYGLKQVVSGTGWIFHHGAATVSTFLKQQETRRGTGPNYKIMIEENRARCIADLKLLGR